MVQKSFDAPDLLPVAPGSLDAVVMNMNYHDMVIFKIDRDKVNAAVFKALKPGGFYDIVDHSAKDGSGIKDVSLHRIDEKFLIDAEDDELGQRCRQAAAQRCQGESGDAGQPSRLTFRYNPCFCNGTIIPCSFIFQSAY